MGHGDPDLILMAADPTAEDPNKLIKVASGDLWRNGRGGELIFETDDPRIKQLVFESQRVVLLFGDDAWPSKRPTRKRPYRRSHRDH